MQKKTITVSGRVSKFPGKGGWFYIEVPKKYTENLKRQRKVWGMFPVKVKINNTSWYTKLMMKKGGYFFVAFNKEIRKKENIVKNEKIKINITLK